MRPTLLLPLLLLPACSPSPAPTPAPAVFTNPILEHYPDPHVLLHEGRYLSIRSLRGERLELRRTPDLTDLAHAESKIVWTPPPNTEHSKQLWAPELHRLAGAWYIYYAASDGNSDHHHLYVLENTADDPFTGAFTMKARLKTDPADNWAIDATVFEHEGSLYMAWSGWPAPLPSPKFEETACLYIARLANPWSLASDRVEISRPTLPWERHWRNPPEWNKTPGRPVFVNEGPAFLRRNDRLFLAYSASGCWTPTYCLGLLSADANADLLNPASWHKSPTPVFQQDPAAGVFGTGHHCFLKSPDGAEDWFVYHASDKPNECGGQARSARLQRLTWSPDGLPQFGAPTPIGRPIPKPSGSR